MDHDSTDHPTDPRPRAARPAAAAAVPQDLAAPDLDPATSGLEEEDEARLPDLPEDSAEPVAEGPLTLGHAAIEQAVRLAPTSPGSIGC